jgi:hypothetical protein
MGFAQYREKRNFTTPTEPIGQVSATRQDGARLCFVVHKRAAPRLGRAAAETGSGRLPIDCGVLARLPRAGRDR